MSASGPSGPLVFNTISVSNSFDPDQARRKPMFIAYVQKPTLNTHADASSGARDLNLRPSIHLHHRFR